MLRRTGITHALFSFCFAVGMTSAAEAQLFFEADAVFLGRNHDGGSSVVSGQETLTTSNGSFGAEPGYRLGIGMILENFQVDAGFTQVNPWVAESSGMFSTAVNMDGGNPSRLDFNGFLKNAASSAFSGEDGEVEAFGPGATYTNSTRSNYRDFEINIGSSYATKRWRLSGGFRSVQLDEKNTVGIDGLFTETPPNQGLSDTALWNAGATLIAGPGTGFADGTDLIYSIDTSTKNQLNGFQTTFGVQFIDGKWVSLEGIAKVGIYRNHMSGQIIETAAGDGAGSSVYQQYLTSSKDGAAFAGNLGLRAVVGITDYIDLVGGGEVLFLNGLALGNDQLDGVRTSTTGLSTYQVQNKGSMVGYGGTIGLRIFW